MARLHWLLARFTERLSIAGYAAIVTLLATILAIVGLWLPAKNKLLALENAPKLVQSAIKTESDQDRLNAFLAKFPQASSRMNSVQTIVDTAKSNGLGIDNISYKSEQAQDDRLTHYHIEFNVIGAYPPLRSFIATLLAKMPYASLDTLSMTRDDANQDFIQTRVRLTLHFAS